MGKANNLKAKKRHGSPDNMINILMELYMVNSEPVECLITSAFAHLQILAAFEARISSLHRG